ncbi:MAG TPA: hypothetical protein VIE43_12535 [Thermoanaerobaculia bacterium]|jgi:hypothetical protein|nr:hypothetical protein [Thermoanaerobaculia bacterium]
MKLKPLWDGEFIMAIVRDSVSLLGAAFGLTALVLRYRRRSKVAANPGQPVNVLRRFKEQRSDDRALAIALIAGAVPGYEIALELWGRHVSPLFGFIALAAVGVLVAAHLALRYRIRLGLFGTNEYEARQVLHFVLDNADKHDFSGGLGVEDLETRKVSVEIPDGLRGLATP